MINAVTALIIEHTWDAVDEPRGGQRKVQMKVNAARNVRVKV